MFGLKHEDILFVYNTDAYTLKRKCMMSPS